MATTQCADPLHVERGTDDGEVSRRSPPPGRGDSCGSSSIGWRSLLDCGELYVIESASLIPPTSISSANSAICLYDPIDRAMEPALSLDRRLPKMEGEFAMDSAERFF
eukprot:CAMPEP_0176318838 /NCGR_PEP_ID=MMETSP0121_2-20121125/69985_1 /TAXON_ID=160619 /ORGANISM="Kryptoperidinium foliaceum, Strain CCMP 1326" /LENGTH=107 /DNA_ID=CAMNT_0017661153 /DNA_START=51 /DNA_END=371 /DNA_ORIENTATION=+